MIERFTQGQSKRSDKKLFGLIGRWIVDNRIHEQLGTAVTADDGDIWLVHISGTTANGFINARLLKNGGMHIRFVYCGDHEDVCRDMIDAVLDLAVGEQRMSVYTNDRADMKIWSEYGFTPTPKPRGVFCRWDKPLQGEKDVK